MPENSDLVMGVDGGGSHTTAWLASLDGEILGKGRSEASNYQSVGERAALNALDHAIQNAFAQADQPVEKLGCLCFGLSGFGRDFEKRLVNNWAEKRAYAHNIVVVNDADLLLWAATPDGWGIGVVCGTGSIAVGRTAEGSTARAGGWGYLIGDEGSGYSLGLDALRAAVRAADRRIPPTLLGDAVLDALGLTRIEELVARVYQKSLPRPAIARLAEIVFSASSQGDHHAGKIIEEAAEELAAAVMAVYKTLGWRDSVPCALGGGVFLNHPEFVHQVVVRSADRGVGLDPVGLAPEPVIGAVRLGIHSLKSVPKRDES
jgi:N-acetylglucosamine kinase-like BadF-type ATPase